MQDRPTHSELLEAVREFLEREIAPEQTDPRLRFRTLVAVNALTILERETSDEQQHVNDEAVSLLRLLESECSGRVPDGEAARRRLVLDLNIELADRIRRGAAPSGTLEHLLRVVTAKLAIASPGYLARYRKTG
jgi:hypothetical protein